MFLQAPTLRIWVTVDPCAPGDTDDRLYIWIEATWMSADGTLYGAYHYEPDALCVTNNHLPTAPVLDVWVDSSMVEQRPFKSLVQGSNPCRPTILNFHRLALF